MILRAHEILSHRQENVQIVIVSSSMELHSYTCKGQKHLEEKVEAQAFFICMKIYRTLLSKISQRKQRELKCVP